ncbi:hypothetical protein CNBL2930 [Cryptococcus deneoformans B-3501A]|uniref:Uncharacterized protein n=1 Tax=Cryptococcus deneoformans (strain JEC21 / ATCC MYA-565) TaxID=214684 RepID=Q5KD05_CRYD1|nr:hypothetical protein CNH02860 [Cryptococcus neoformans var. neoformans JEC21]XP_772427.1 hypothetical protein CNBL2930 [Cryptococcus neoformans var. neoformans B-3501A]AAW45150.1 hypothetical protein CNH02860 [Cryptococcus neoformans var. neoformans JEC21]EAL17780.1 hypothetical protein CNBL2930 [Cryptococcus neoformans var. neoformans B-3501A]
MSLIRTALRLSRPSISSTRFLHSSRRVFASEIPPNPFEDPIFKAFADRVKQHQGAVDAMKGLMNVMQQKGFDKNKKPTMMQMIEMASDKDLKAAASVLMSELQKAGVDQTEAMEIFKKASSR